MKILILLLYSFTDLPLLQPFVCTSKPLKAKNIRRFLGFAVATAPGLDRIGLQRRRAATAAADNLRRRSTNLVAARRNNLHHWTYHN